MVIWLIGWAAGVACQLQQAWLWSVGAYLALLAGAGTAFALRLWLASRTGVSIAAVFRLSLALFAAGALAFSTVGLRALQQQADLLDPRWEEQPLWLEGTVADLPQRHTDGQVFVVAVQKADSDGLAIRAPAQVRLFWPGAPDGLQAGEVWRWPVRLRAPHGLFNRHGFDRELWLWEQAVGATGVVRVGPRVAAPTAVGSTWRHQVDRRRGQLTQAVRARVDDARSAGVIAALLVGNQSAIALVTDKKDLLG